MSLAGFDKQCTKRIGGVDSLFLARMRDLEAVEYDPSSSVFTSVSLSDGARFARFDFREDSCRLYETAARSCGVLSVRHEIAFSLPGNGQGPRKAVSELAGNGLIAIVLTNEGKALLVGYSHLFRDERPLRLVSFKSSTGFGPEDAPENSITLISEDTDLSCPYTGVLPY